MTPRTAQTNAPVLDLLAERWSPRAFDRNHTLDLVELNSILEAARWAPSASNTQPWRFIVARRGEPNFAAILNSLMPGNEVWAGSASALIVNVAEIADETGIARPWARYDLGQAVAHMSVQAQSLGLFTHQMGGFEHDTLSEAFGLGGTLVPISVTALGALGDASNLPEALREREGAPRERMPLEALLLARD